MKGKKIVPVVVLAMLLAVALCSCGLFSSPENGNNSNTPQSVTVRIHDVTENYKATDFVDKNTMTITFPAQNPEKAGYDFDGWFADEACTKALRKGEKVTTSVLDIYPRWVVATVQVRIVDERNGTSVVNVTYNGRLEIDEPRAEGYTFEGYFTDANRTVPYDLTTKLTEDVDIYVKWSPKTFTVRFMVEGVETGRQTYTKGTDEAFAAAEDARFTFDRWYLDESLTEEALSSEEAYDGNSELVSVYGKVVWHVAEATLATSALKVSEEPGVDFEMDTDYKKQDVNLQNNFTFSTRSTVVIKDDADNVLAGGVAKLPVNTGDDTVVYTFTMTVTAEDGTTQQTYVIKVCQYDSSLVTVTFKADGVAVKTLNEVHIGETIESESAYTYNKTAYDFLYWAKNGSEYDFSTPVTESFDLIATYAPTQYTITYSVGYGENAAGNPATYDIEDDVVLENAAAPEGYTFVGWFTDETYATPITGWGDAHGDRTIYARYTKAAKWSFALNGENKYEINKAQYPDLYDYLLFAGITNAPIVIVDGTPAPEEELEAFYKTQRGEVSVNHELHISYSTNGQSVTLTIGYSSRTETSETGWYTQTSFAPIVTTTGRSDDFDDFAVDHIERSYTVSDTEHLYTVLESGYRPVCVEDTVADETYLEMRAILREIVDDGMTDKEKCLAIAEYLVKTVAYDNFAYVNYNNEAIKAYRCFDLEGAVLDKIAVCDGISKAFACMARMEGIEAIRVTGTHGGPHAWNKVRIDLDGDGDKEWTVVDCTSANTLNDSAHEEYINYAYIFTTDAMLAANGYVYATEWSGVYSAAQEYCLFTDEDFTYDGTHAYGVENQAELNALTAYYKSVFDTLTAGQTMCFSIYTTKAFGCNGNKPSDAIGAGLVAAGFTGGYRYVTTEDGENVTLIIFKTK